MKNIMKKIGWTIVSMLPILGFLAIQIGCTVVATVVLMLTGNLGAVMDMVIPILIVSQILTSIAAGLWYYFAWGKKKRPEGTPKPEEIDLLMIVVMGLAAQFFISSILTAVQVLAPELMESYNELMEQAGIMEGTVLTLISTVLLAPLSEELVCRGLVYRIAGKVSPKFWVANIIQALAFGILHGNLVQGIYAFALGIVLGMLYGRFRNIWLCMLLHAAMNASSMLVNPVYMLFTPADGEPPMAALCVVLVISGALLALCMKVVFGRKSEK